MQALRDRQARQAQSRLKELERMKKVAQAPIDSPFSFNFPAPGKVSDPLLTLSEAALGHGVHTVLSQVSVSLSPGDLCFSLKEGVLESSPHTLNFAYSSQWIRSTGRYLAP